MGSRCIDTMAIIHAEDIACKNCPGSGLYIYESDEGIECCMCQFDFDGFHAKNEREMFQHILQHDSADHHVRRSILKIAKEEFGI